MAKIVFSVFLWIYWAVCIITFFFLVTVLYLLTFVFDPFNTIPNKTLRVLAQLMLKVNPYWSIKIIGADAEKITEPTIVIANHQSFLDLPLLYLLPWSMKWVAKKGLFKIPILGWIIHMTGQLRIDRKSMRSARKLDALVSPITAGIPGMIFPEGSRSRDGSLQLFKNGAFKLAQKYNFKILPIVLKGGNEAMPPGDWQVSTSGEFAVSVLDPIDVQQFNSPAELRDHAFSLINKELSSL